MSNTRWMSEYEYQRRRLRVIVVSMLAGAASVVIGTWVGDALEDVTERAQASCQEDMPCWDCSTHGNKICDHTEAGSTSPSWPGTAP